MNKQSLSTEMIVSCLAKKKLSSSKKLLLFFIDTLTTLQDTNQHTF